MLNFEFGRTAGAIGNLSDWSDESGGSDWLGVEVGGEWISRAYDMTLWCKCGYNGVTICIY